MASSSLKREPANPQLISDYRLANRLITAAKLDKAPPTVIPNFRADLLTEIVRTLPIARSEPGAHDDETLVRIAGHTCTIESLHTNTVTLANSIDDRRRDGVSEEDIQIAKTGYYRLMAYVLAYGFDKVEESKLTRDATGRVIAITEERLRNTECAKALLERGEQFGGKKKRRQTKKKIHKKRKTLRRTRH